MKNNKKPHFKRKYSAYQLSLLSQLDEVMIADKWQLKNKINALNTTQNGVKKDGVTKNEIANVDKINAINNANIVDKTNTIEKKIQLARQRLLARKKININIDFPDNLPVFQRQAEIIAAIANHQVIIIAGETGSGKTTQLAKMCLQSGLGRKGLIGHTQPRRIAARSVANRIAEELQTQLGDVVGYKVRFTDHINEHTLVKLMTDGILLSEIKHDRYLNQYDTLIIDEAHERSLNSDFILGYLKQLLPKRPDLKLIITSATIDLEKFSKHFNHAPIIEVSGRTFPVEVRYRPLTENIEHDQLQGIVNAVEELQQQGRGDILIFLSGEREIRDTADALTKQGFNHTEILPLYARLSSQEQNKIFYPSNINRIILATNVAETSLTVPGIKYVIDPGMARISRYSYRSKVQRLPIEPISQASANQRKGRCGRTSEGICIRLYSEQDFMQRPQFTDPEILRTNLASVILQMIALGLDNIEAFPFIDAPDRRHIQDGIKLLEELQVFQTIKSKQNKKRELNEIGRQIAQLPIDPRLAKMLVMAASQNCMHEMMIIVSALSIQDPRERPRDKLQASDEKHHRFNDKKSDFLAFVNLWQYIQQQRAELTRNQFHKLCKKEFLNYLRIQEWQDIYQQIRTSVRGMKFKINSEAANFAQIHIALLSGLLSHIGMKEAEKQLYLGARNTHFSIFPNSSLFKKPPKWCMATELVETTKLWGRIVAYIEPEWIEPLAQHLIKKSHSEPHWSKSKGQVLAKEKVTLFGIPIVVNRLIGYDKIDPIVSRKIFIQSALIEGNWHTKHLFFSRNTQLIKEVEELEYKTRRRDILIDEQQLFDFYDQKIDASITSQKHFDYWWKKVSQNNPNLLDFNKPFLMGEKENLANDIEFPDFWHQGELKFKLTYQFEPSLDADGVTVHLPLSLLNQIKTADFDWLISGFRQELVIALIKSLPKTLRKNFVPAPNYAQAFLARAIPFSEPITESLAKHLRQMTGIVIEPNSWNWEQVPNYLKMRFSIFNHQGQEIASSYHLEKLKIALKTQIQTSIATIADKGIERTGISEWDFPELPQLYEKNKQGFSIKAYPAIVDEKHSVGIKLFETKAEQQQAMQTGTRRLLLMNIPSPIKFLHEKLPNKSKLALYFTPFGNVLELIDDCIACAMDQLINEFGGLVWAQADFERLRHFIRENVNSTTILVATQIEQILTLVHKLNQSLKGKIELSLALSFTDIKQQIEHLIYPGFVEKTGYSRLADLQRYLLAIEKRIEKLAQDINRDRINMLRIEKVKDAYQQLLLNLPKSIPIPSDILDIRYMIEELRVSLFAQQLGTRYPISDKRIMNAISDATRTG